ncbi:uncharacterized protein LOC135153917 [Lytechinus pictus]|uniref:uncharacterized protein LOC135153917 n=1 Tax=Lytechinus pictus TaxID=7653 RepID=UPI0030BA114C
MASCKWHGLISVFTALMMISLCKCDSILTVTEDEDVTLEFLYPCDSYKVTIQKANGLPFYDSNNQDGQDLYLPIYDADRFSVGHENCSVRVFISPVKRGDEATYICLAYRSGITHIEFTRVRLNVNYPPGKASCSFEISAKAGWEWLPLHCTASVGTLEGEIQCYQDSKRLPPQSRLVKAKEMFEQTILVSKESPVFCCSSRLNSQPKDMCDCRDFTWKPLRNSSQTKTIVDPCPLTTPHLSTTLSQTTARKVGNTQLLQSEKLQKTMESAKPIDAKESQSVKVLALIFGSPFAMLLLVALLNILEQFLKILKKCHMKEPAHTCTHTNEAQTQTNFHQEEERNPASSLNRSQWEKSPNQSFLATFVSNEFKKNDSATPLISDQV